MRNKFISVFLIIYILLMMPMAVSAQDPEIDRMGSVSVTLKAKAGKTPITGAEFSLYYVATLNTNINNGLSYTFTDEFDDCGFDLDNPELSGKLDAFVKDDSASADKLMTDDNGKLMFTDLPLGLYFVKQTNTVSGYAPCTSFIVKIPDNNSGRYVYDVSAAPKTDIAKLTDITVRKVWNTDESVEAEESVTVQLLRDNLVVETATLSAQNNWQLTYANMPESDAYSIVEVNVPKGFIATYSRNGYVFTVTNSTTLIQSGQLIWPIPVLAMAGLCLIAVGTIILRKTRNKNA